MQDGMSSFGFGAHDSSAEIMASKYNVVTVYTKAPEYSFLVGGAVPLAESANYFAACVFLHKLIE